MGTRRQPGQLMRWAVSDKSWYILKDARTGPVQQSPPNTKKTVNVLSYKSQNTRCKRTYLKCEQMKMDLEEANDHSEWTVRASGHYIPSRACD